MVCPQQFASFQDLVYPGNGSHKFVAKRVIGHAGRRLLNPLGTGFRASGAGHSTCTFWKCKS